MEALPQLFMRHPDLSNIRPLLVPDDIQIVTHSPELISVWEDIIERAFEHHYSFDTTIQNSQDLVGDFNPEHCLYLKANDKIVATTTAIENCNFPGEGYFHMVAADPDAQGKGYGKLIGLVALHSLKDRGYKTAVLSTDDFRIPAIRAYLFLGFEPIYSHESHQGRWEKVFSEIEKLKK